MSENCFFCVPPKGKMKPVATVDEALESLKHKCYIWLDFVDPKREDLEALVQPLEIHPLSVEDCFDNNQVPKIEDFPTNNFMIFNNYLYEEGSLKINEVGIILGRNFLVTVNRRNGACKTLSSRMEETINHGIENIRKGPDFLFHIILDDLVDKKISAIEALEEDLNNAEEQILDSAPGFSPRELIRIRRCLLSLRKSLFHEREILVKICRRDSRFISEKAIYHFRDIYDHLVKFFETTEIYREMISSLMEMYLSMLNNKMAVVANRTNLVVRRLTLITTIFMPLTLLAGIGGMSEWTAMTGPDNWKISYPGFLLLMIVVAYASYLLLKWAESHDMKKNPVEEAPEQVGNIEPALQTAPGSWSGKGQNP